MIKKELVLSKKINEKIKEKELSQRKLAKLIDYSDTTLNSMILGKQSFSESVIKKLLPILEISRDEFDSWIIADKYSKEIIELAIKAKREVCHPVPDAGSNKQTNKIGKIPDRVRNDKRGKLILTANIDNILEEKGLSRTALAKQIQYSQSGLNRMIIGEIGLSKSVLEKISNVLEVPQDKITGWILADSYNLDTLKMACVHK